ncbi:MAG: CHAP domain-containing protein, partial [Dongiaceae bacterium]
MTAAPRVIRFDCLLAGFAGLAAIGVLLLAGCASAPKPPAAPSGGGAIAVLPTPTGPMQCVPYARQVSGIDIRGDAWTWWDSADGQYRRGKAPKAGAVLVFHRTNRLPRG